MLNNNNSNDDERIYKASDAQCSVSLPTDWWPEQWATSPWPALPSLYAECDFLWYGIALGSFGVSCHIYVPSHLLAHLQPAPWQGSKRRQKVFDWVSTAQQQLQCYCVINIILVLNPKHSIIPAAKKKINSIPAETGQCLMNDEHRKVIKFIFIQLKLMWYKNQVPYSLILYHKPSW